MQSSPVSIKRPIPPNQQRKRDAKARTLQILPNSILSSSPGIMSGTFLESNEEQPTSPNTSPVKSNAPKLPLTGDINVGNVEAIRGSPIPPVLVTSVTDVEGRHQVRVATATSNASSRKSIIREGSIDPWMMDDACIPCVEDDDDQEHHWHHKSEFSHSLFNMVNLLLGIGLLALPYSLSLTGWIIGMTLLLFLCLATIYTAFIITRCLDIQLHGVFLSTYADIAAVAFGPTARIVVNVLVMLDLLSATIAPFILMSDSLHALMPDQSLIKLKLILFACVAPTLWTTGLRWNSYASLLGIFAILILVSILFFLSFYEPNQHPGSILHPEPTHLFPPDFNKIPISFGIMMAALCGHICLPSIYKDMKDPSQFPRLILVAYVIIVTLYVTVASWGYLMYGDATLPEITQNLAATKWFPKAVTSIPLILFVINPFTKIALTLDPINKSLEREYAQTTTSHFVHMFTRTLVLGVVVGIAIIFPKFDRMMALLGSGFAFATAIVIPCLAYLRLRHLIPSTSRRPSHASETTPLISNRPSNLDLWQVVWCWFLIITASILAMIGTLWTLKS